jgi:hypothetical protein
MVTLLSTMLLVVEVMTAWKYYIQIMRTCGMISLLYNIPILIYCSDVGFIS